MGDRMHRKNVGKHFSEGARLCWTELRTRGLSVSDLARATGLPASQLHRALYGDCAAAVAVVVPLEAQLGVSVAKWTEAPSEAFVPPGAQDDEEPVHHAATGTEGV